EAAQVLVLAAHAALFARRAVMQDIAPVDSLQDRLDLVGTIAGRVHPADDRAHGGADDAIDRHPLALQYPQQPDVCGAAGPATAQHQAGTGAMPVVTAQRSCKQVGRRDAWRRKQDRGGECHHLPQNAHALAQKRSVAISCGPWVLTSMPPVNLLLRKSRSMSL